MYIFNLQVRNKILLREKDSNFRFVGDNVDYFIHFDIDVPYEAMFAKFHTKNGDPKPILLDENGNVNVPLSVLKEGQFDVGLYKDGYATTPFSVWVDGSILNETGIPIEEPETTQVEQLIGLVNGIQQVGIQSAEVNDEGHLIFTLTDGTVLDAGYVGSSGGGAGIKDFQKTEETGEGSTYTFTLSDGRTFSFTVKNGKDGEPGKQGEKGDKGDTGQSAYDSAVKGGYSGTETEFYADLAAVDNLAAWFASI